MTERFTKQVEIIAKNDEARTAAGVVLTPFELDRQLDWLRPEGIQNLYNENPNDGVMHAAFPEGHADLERNEVLAEPETIDGEAFDAGEWVIRRRYNDEKRWQLVQSGVLSSFSIGGEVTDAVGYASVDELPDNVDIPDEVDPDAVPPRYHPPTEIVDGSIDEISDVDVGAVPSADMAVVKSIGKNILEEAPTEESFLRVMSERNPDASADELTALWKYLQSVEKVHKQEDLPPAVEACKESLQAGKPEMSDSEAIAICREQLDMATDTDEPKADERAESRSDDTSQVTNGMSDDSDTDPEMDSDSAEKSVGDVDDATLGARLKQMLLPGTASTDDAAGAEGQTQGDDAEKAGRTLSAQNVREAKAVHDHATRLLHNESIDEPNGMSRTYDKDDRDEFSLTSFSKAHDTDTDHATNTEITMTDDTEKSDDPPEWAQSLTDQVETLAEKLDDSTGEDEAEQDVEDEQPKWAKSLIEQVDTLEDRVDKVAKKTADTDQATGEGDTETEDGDSLDELAKLLG